MSDRIIGVRFPDGTLVPLLGMRNTKTGALRPLTAEEERSLEAQWTKYGDHRASVVRGDR